MPDLRGKREPGTSITDSGFTRTGLWVAVLYIFRNTWQGSGPCLAETVQRGSRERFPFLFGLIDPDQELE